MASSALAFPVALGATVALTLAGVHVPWWAILTIVVWALSPWGLPYLVVALAGWRRV